MKKIIALLCLCMSVSSFALDGLVQAKVEKAFDTLKMRFLDPLPTDQQSKKIQQIQKMVDGLVSKSTISSDQKDILTYFNHLLCEGESIIDGMVCQDNYTPPSQLTASKDTLTLDQIRKLLIAEHSQRRLDRGFSALTESTTLDTIAQNYALALCKAGYITHELNGSTLEKRFQDAGYVYSWGGENLGSGQNTIAEILDQLTTSIHHRENMYQPEFREIGVGQCDSTWVLDYGTPQ